MLHEPIAAIVRSDLVHVVGLMRDEVFSFVGPATRALERSGRAQILVMIDEPRYRHHLAALPDSVELVLAIRCRNPITQWAAVFKACRRSFASNGVTAVHLHGMLPCLVGVLALQSMRHSASIIFSPHASRALRALRVLGRGVRPLVRPFLKRTQHAVVVNVPWETTDFMTWKHADLVESPVREVFFETPRNEARYPLIVTGGREQSVRNAQLFARLAVLLSGDDLKIGFNWIGVVDPTTQRVLDAAGIGIFDCPIDAECASRLGAGWVYLAPGSTRGFPVFVAQAMAVGLPCVVQDCIQHREVIVHGVNGYLCRTDRQMIHWIAALIDSPDLRERIGQAARTSVLQRFGEGAFHTKLLEAYEFAID